MIHDMKEVNIREKNGMVNKCRHQEGILTLSKLAFLSTGDSTQYSTSFRVNNITTLSFTQNHNGTRQNKMNGLNPGYLETGTELTVA